jgi:hypothetical protein
MGVARLPFLIRGYWPAADHGNFFDESLLILV